MLNALYEETFGSQWPEVRMLSPAMFFNEMDFFGPRRNLAAVRSGTFSRLKH